MSKGLCPELSVAMNSDFERQSSSRLPAVLPSILERESAAPASAFFLLTESCVSSKICFGFGNLMMGPSYSGEEYPDVCDHGTTFSLSSAVLHDSRVDS